MHFSIDRTVHTTAFDKPVVDHWLNKHKILIIKNERERERERERECVRACVRACVRPRARVCVL